MATRKRSHSPADDDAQQTKRKTTEEGVPGEEEEVDPLDAFMAEVQEQVKHQQLQPKTVRLHEATRCDGAEDPVAEFMEEMGVGAQRTWNEFGSDGGYANWDNVGDDSDDEVYAAARAADQNLEAEYDSDDQLLIAKREIGLIPAVDHEAVEYEEFDKDFYEPCNEIRHKTTEQVREMRENHGIKASGYDAASPVASFFQCGFDLPLLSVIKKQKYEKPTPIQMQTLPVALSGRDVVGLAKTGSGKTAAYVLPLCIHVMAAPALKKGEGPLALVMAPTRELSEQIHKQARIFGKPYNMSIAACFGGLRKYDQIKALKAGCDAVVATPGRMIDLIKAFPSFHVSFGQDRMFDMGLEKQVRSILSQIRPDRQTLLFSATLPRKMERLCQDVLTNPIRISIGRVGAVNEDIQQRVEVLTSDVLKRQWLQTHLSGLVDMGEVLIFANQKHRVDEVTERLVQSGFRVAAIHGDMDQHSRMHVLQAFREEVYHVLVATDVAARGLDIPSIKTIVNFDCAKDADSHTHRVGRTGRAGDKEGIAYTLVTPEETRQAAFLVSSLTAAGQDVSEALHSLAMKDSRFSRGKGRKGKGRRGAGRVGGSGLGFQSTSSEHQESLADFTPSHTKMESEWVSSMGASQGKPTDVTTFVVRSEDRLEKSFRTNAFNSSFVSSGVQSGDQKQRATVLAPKRASKTYVPPPPVPVTERPLVAARPGQTRPVAPSRPVSNSPNIQSTGNEFQKAFAAAQEIAARFGGTVAKGNPSQEKHT